MGNRPTLIPGIMALPWQCILLIIALFDCCNGFHANMSASVRRKLSLQVKEMFLHAYHSYKKHAFPADELMPLSCRGRFRGVEPSRGDVDDALGNFSLTMIDTLDSLFLFNELDEFEDAVKAIISTVKFDSDIDVSVFETNIRVLGGLLGGHVSALELKKRNPSKMTWYTDQLLQMSVDIANRLLPAFDTATGIPLPRVNLRHGVDGLTKKENHTCTACGGTMILEFATLSRLTGIPIFEEKAALGLAYLWKQRNRHSDLVGHVIDVHSGEWIRKESGIGAGFDSYYEYLLKAYVLFGESVYLHRFNTHYEAIKRYVSGPESAEFPFLFLNVLMHRPSQRSRAFMDALFAFWPGLQVLTGDVKSAVASHEFLFQVNKRNIFLPEAFTVDFNVHWAEHLLRPEFIESTYLLHSATGDPYYLAVGEQLVENLQRYTRVPCGFAAVQDVRTMKLLDRLDSFVLAETFKYLYLLFTDLKELPIDLDEYVFTTEAHLLPLGLPKLLPTTAKLKTSSQPASEPSIPSDYYHGDRDHVTESWLRRRVQCPAVDYLGIRRRYRHRLCPATVHHLDGGLSEVCDVLQGISPHRGRLFWLQSTDPHHHDLICPPNNATAAAAAAAGHSAGDPAIQNGIWSVIDVIRRPLRQLALSFGLSPTSDNKAEENFEKQDMDATLQAVGGAMPLRAASFRLNDATHLASLRRMGVEIAVDDAGRMSIRHDQNLAENANLALAGLLFIHDLLKLSRKKPEEQDPPTQSWYVVFLNAPHFGRTRLSSCPAHFSLFPGEFTQSANPPSGFESPNSVSASDSLPSWKPLIGQVRIAQPLDACSPLATTAAAYPTRSLDWSGSPHTEQPVTDDAASVDEEQKVTDSAGSLSGSIALVRRGGCLFIEKARNLLRAGAVGGIVVDIGNESSASRTPMFTMSGETENDRQHLPLAFTMLFAEERDSLLAEMRRSWELSRRPAVIMLAKQASPPQALYSSLESLLPPKPGVPASDDGEHLTLSSRLSSSASFHVSKRSWLRLDPLLLFTVSRLSDNQEEVADQIRVCRGQTGSLEQHLFHHSLHQLPVCSRDTGSRWLLQVIADDETAGQRFLPSVASPKDVPPVISWLTLVDQVMDKLHCCKTCRGLLLAVVETAVHLNNAIIAQQHSESGQSGPGVSLPPAWFTAISDCFSDLLHSISHAGTPLPDILAAHVVTLNVTFSLVGKPSDDDDSA